MDAKIRDKQISETMDEFTKVTLSGFPKTLAEHVNMFEMIIEVYKRLYKRAYDQGYADCKNETIKNQN